MNGTFGKPFDGTLDKLGPSSRPFDALMHNKSEAGGHESFEKLRTISPRINVLAGGLEQEKGAIEF